MTDGFRICSFCGCNTNARRRRCCELGSMEDDGQLDLAVVERWKEQARQQLESASRTTSRESGSWPPPPVSLANVAYRELQGRIVLLAAEMGRQRARIDREILRVAARDAWTDAAREVGIASPGGMQQAKRMAVAAVDALGLRYDETSPSDIREEASK